MRVVNKRATSRVGVELQNFTAYAKLFPAIGLDSINTPENNRVSKEKR
jgi:hypothetical protein